MKKKVLIGLSGGVDSAVAALILLKQGYEVQALTMTMFDQDSNQDIINKAKKISNQLNIKHHVLDCKEVFLDKIINNFVSEYLAGRTPNPCVACNKYIKFGLFLDYAKKQGFDYISTGHFAEIFFDKNNHEYLLKKSVFGNKDQSYFLYNLNQDILKYILLPISKYNKSEIKKIALESDLILENYKESQDICFIPGGKYVDFLENITNKKSLAGNFVDKSGNILGKHGGIWNYTIGQRKGLGKSFNKKMFVVDININNNEVVLSAEDPMSNKLVARDINIVSPKRFKDEMIVDAKIRYKHKAQKARIYLKNNKNNNEIEVVFLEPQRAITRGQSVVFYQDDIVIGGGIIK
ncbi:MAG: tRNA 2-thiouridine(34) synthase MnmA [Oscillospiraceae bacterium]|nr:tRNA 2-thiouridine(34) synthase MnmA [Oscillospiraceae bacterium]